MTTPQTAAGRALLDDRAPITSHFPGTAQNDADWAAREKWSADILAIEAEARAAALDEARAAVEAVPTRHPHGIMATYQHIDKPAALAAIDALRRDEG